MVASHPRGERFPPGETRREQPPATGLPSAWAIARGCTAWLRSCPVTDRARGGIGLRGFTLHVGPSWGNFHRGQFHSLPRKPLLPLPRLDSREVSPSAWPQLRFGFEFVGGSTAPPAATETAVPFGVHHPRWPRRISACTLPVIPLVPGHRRQGQAARLPFWRCLHLEPLVNY